MPRRPVVRNSQPHPEHGPMQRLRADEIKEGDLYVNSRPAIYGEVLTLNRETEKTPGGATITRIRIETATLGRMNFAPHSRHWVRPRKAAVES